MVRSNLVGLEDVQKWAKYALNTVRNDIESAVDKTAKDLVRDGREFAQHKDQTGDTRRAITANVIKRKGSISILFFGDTKTGTVMMPSGYNRLWMLNDGTYDKYKMGRISPTANTVGAVEGKKGLPHVDFMGKSWDKNIGILEKRLQSIFDRVR